MDEATIQLLRDILSIADREKLFQDFLTSLQEHIKILDLAVPSGDLAKIKFAAHTIKGNSSNIGASRLFELTRIINDQPDHPNLTKLHLDIELLAEKTLGQLRQKLVGAL